MATIIAEQNVPARMRDGVTLYADVFRPAEPGRYPVILSRTPYGRARAEVIPDTLALARAGYVAIVQDCRGCGDSEGQFSYLKQLSQEGADGYDAVEWAAALPYSDGNVGMSGGSYDGVTQWAAAMQRPPHLHAIAPLATPGGVHNMCFRGGAFELGVVLVWHLLTCPGVVTRELTAAGASADEIGKAAHGITAALDRLCADGYAELPLRAMPSLRALGLDDILGYVLDLGADNQPREWRVAHDLVDVPSLIMGGWYDIFAQDTIDHYAATCARGQGQTRLVFGPWIHAAWTSTIGDMDLGVGANSASLGLTDSVIAIQVRWFDHWLKGIDNGIDREPPVKVFLTGDNRWLDLADWPPTGVREQPLYLHTGGALGPALPATGSPASHYTYDPADPAPTLGGNTVMPGAYPAGIKDQRPLSQRPDVLTFTSAPLEEPLTVMGRVTAHLWASSSAPDTDFVARLIDVHPDGYMENLCDGILRARYRNSLQEPAWLEPGEAYELPIDLWSTAHVFKAGHRAALQVTSSSFPRWDRNWNTKEDPAWAMGGQPAEQTIWHDAAHPSRVVLPVVPTA